MRTATKRRSPRKRAREVSEIGCIGVFVRRFDWDDSVLLPQVHRYIERPGSIYVLGGEQGD